MTMVEEWYTIRNNVTHRELAFREFTWDEAVECCRILNSTPGAGGYAGIYLGSSLKRVYEKPSG